MRKLLDARDRNFALRVKGKTLRPLFFAEGNRFPGDFELKPFCAHRLCSGSIRMRSQEFLPESTLPQMGAGRGEVLGVAHGAGSPRKGLLPPETPVLDNTLQTQQFKIAL